MILTLHGVFLAYLLLLLLWNVAASAPAGPEAVPAGAGAAAGGRSGRRRVPWERFTLLPLQLLLTGVLVADRLAPQAPSLLNHAWLAHLFPLAFLLALVQNLHCLVQRGPRLTDVPIILCNVGLGASVAVGALALSGAGLGEREATLLYDHSLLQHLLGNRLAHVSALSWHLPVLARRGEPATIAGVAAGLVAAAFAAFCVLVLVLFQREAGAVLVRFHGEPRVEAPRALRADLGTGVFRDPRAPPVAGAPFGSLDAWVLPADDDGRDLPARGGQRPLVLALRAPDAWALSLPDADTVLATFLDGAERLAGALRPAVLLPFPEPDGEATLYVGAEIGPARWRELYAEARRRIRAASPETAVAARLLNAGERTHALFAALAAEPACVDIAGPRLQPGSSMAAGPAQADAVLAAWTAWRAAVPEPPALWVLAAGLSPQAYGAWAQARFVEGCLVRADRDPAVRALIFDAWEDRGSTLGLRRLDGTLRPAGLRLQELLVAP